MKPIGVMSTAALFLLFGIAAPANGRQEKPEEKAPPPKQQEAKPEKQQPQAKAPKHEQQAKAPKQQQEAKPDVLFGVNCHGCTPAGESPVGTGVQEAG